MITLNNAEALQLFEALSIGYENTCSLCCPSQWKTGERPPHSEQCRKIQAARSMLMDLGSWADLRASGGLFPSTEQRGAE